MESSFTPSRRRWAILALLFFSTVLNYVDRQTLSILANHIQIDLNMSVVDYARIVQVFLLTYTIAYVAAGWITDWLGTRRGLALFVGWWSMANMLTGLVQNVVQLGVARGALGLGEAGNYTAGPKAVGEHFPPAERGFAVGVYTAGAMVGATIAPPLIAWLALSYSWRAAFVITGAAGLVWIAVWMLVYRDAPAAAAAGAKPARYPWSKVLRDRSVWGLAATRLVADPVWYFYLFWLPKYMADQYGFGLVQVAQLAWMVYLAADFGSIGGGVLSGLLIKRGIANQRSRLIVMTCAAALGPLGMLIATGVSAPVMIALAAVVAFAHMMFQVNLTSAAVDRYPGHAVATVFGVIAAGSGLGGMLSTQVVGDLVSTTGYKPLFIMMGCLHPIACALAWWGLSGGRPQHHAETTTPAATTVS
ncbi:MFS transporter [Massilia arenosa]|uniref:MFS transporter n=1 Tax=Zemynaea arenosa TaxID=2561931 RepID=A0A4Y9SII4_9BURK|nr:MFS transporter [Massilia arenosa]TFW21835.1 MFS transporter [Massilia arenosa]